MLYWLIVTIKRCAAEILYEEMDDRCDPDHSPGFRALLAEAYWEDCGLDVWHVTRFAAQTALAKWDADPDNPWRLV